MSGDNTPFDQRAKSVAQRATCYNSGSALRLGEPSYKSKEGSIRLLLHPYTFRDTSHFSESPGKFFDEPQVCPTTTAANDSDYEKASSHCTFMQPLSDL